MKHILSTLCLSLCTICMAAQTNITPEVLRSLDSQPASAADRAISNAIQNNSLSNMAKQNNNPSAQDTYFSIDIRNKGISDQKSSGRCWLFTGLNVLRHAAAKKMNHEGLMFSQVYLFFYDQLEKSNLFLQAIIDTRKQPLESQKVQWLMKNALSDGGTYTGVADLVSKYGVVPSDVKPETYVSNATSEFNTHLERKLREIAINIREKSAAGASQKQLEQYKMEQMKTIYHMLTLAYGQPVKEFTWAPRDEKGKYKSEPRKYTPQEFYKEWCQDAGNPSTHFT